MTRLDHEPSRGTSRAGGITLANGCEPGVVRFSRVHLASSPEALGANPSNAGVMERKRVVQAGAVVAAIVLAGVVLYAAGLIPPSVLGTTPGNYDRTTVTVYDAENGSALGEVDVRVADTYRKKYVGLSATESLPANEGMLFTYDSPGNHTYVMRDMDFGIDIVYVGADGRITGINHAPLDGDYEHPGYGQYVLEVNLHWTTDHGVEVGDRVEIDGYD